MFGGDLIGRYTIPNVAVIEAAFGLVVQGSTVALRPAFSAKWTIAETYLLALTAGYIGSAEYRQRSANASVGYRF